MIVFVVSVLIAVLGSFLCSLTESVLLSLNNVKIETDKEKGRKYAVVLHKLKSNINKPISAILILNTIAHTGGATVAGSAFDRIFGSEWIWLFSTLFTFVILLGTEIFPKVLGVSNTGPLSKRIAVPLQWLTWILYPLIVVTELFTRLIIKKKEDVAQYSLEDIQTIAKVARVENIIDKDQERIIVEASRLKTRMVGEIMLPVSETIILKKDMDMDQFYETVEQHLHTRFPITRSDSVADIYGYINFKEIALEKEKGRLKSLDEYVRPLLFFREKESILQALKKLNDKHYHLAIVRNANGENTGMVTLEDIVEEIVGEIEDEFDFPEEDPF